MSIMRSRLRRLQGGKKLIGARPSDAVSNPLTQKEDDAQIERDFRNVELWSKLKLRDD